MNTSTYSDFENTMTDENISPRKRFVQTGEPHLVVQILSVIAFGAFSIVAIALAFAAFWVAGLVLAIVLGGIWAGNRTFGNRRKWGPKHAERVIDNVAHSVSPQRSSGNASFDAYRHDMLARLEQESQDFEGFLMRLREAKDATEFDHFMDDRAAKAREAISNT